MFISFSGARSKESAIVFKEWIRNVIQVVNPFLSEDMEKGVLSFSEISSALTECDFGVLCLTQSNIDAPRINFEAGAMAHQLTPDGQNVSVTGLLIDIKKTTEVKGPLSKFQHTSINRPDIKKLLKLINKHIEGVGRLSETQLDIALETHWNALETKINQINQEFDTESVEKSDPRSDRELLEEIVELSRANRRDAEAIRSSLSPKGNEVSLPNLSRFMPELSQEERTFVQRLVHNIGSSRYSDAGGLGVSRYSDAGGLSPEEE